MKTSEDARRSGQYASECCGEKLVFGKGETFWRCPRCQHLCEWELLIAYPQSQSASADRHSQKQSK
jgi:hypothetical protein